MEDLETGQLINVKDFDFQLFSTINKMDSLGGPDAEYYFEWVNQVGTQTIVSAGPYFSSVYTYEIGQAQKKLKIGMVPKKAGLFQLAFYYLNKNLRNVQLTDSDCVQDIEVFNILDDGGDNNYYLLENNPNPISTLEEFKEGAGYAFIVVE